jgi:hypothetical protein
MKKLLFPLVLIVLILLVKPVLAINQGQIEKDRFVVTYDIVNDVTTITDKWDTGRGIPGTGDFFTGYDLNFKFKVQFPGKVYNPKDPGVMMNLIFVERYIKDRFLQDTRYEYGDTVVLLADDARYKLGAANYSVGEYGDAIVGRHPMEVLMVTISPDILEAMGKAKKMMGVINAQKPSPAKPFNFDDKDIAYVDQLLDVLGGLQKPAATK